MSTISVYHVTRDFRIPAGARLLEGDWSPPAHIKALRDPDEFAAAFEGWLRSHASEYRMVARLAGHPLVCTCPGPRSPRAPCRVIARVLEDLARGDPHA